MERVHRQPVLRDIELTVPRGQTLAIIGESGCGKTVLLKTLIGLIRPTRGEVLFDGQNLLKLEDKQLVQQRIRFGFLFQNAALFDSMTIGQNVAFPLRQHRRTTDQEVQELVLARLAEVGLPDTVVVKKPAELSGGMRKRVGLARALVMNPELMLYDEPTTGLDPIMSDVINELIMSTRRTHLVTSIVVTHDMRTARKVADRVNRSVDLHAVSGVFGRDGQGQSATAEKQALAYFRMDRKTRGPDGVVEDDSCTRLELLAGMDERNPVSPAHALEEQTFD